MKTLFKTFFVTAVVALSLSPNLSAQTNSKDKEEDKPKVEVYYFHNKTRCATCRAIEAETQKNVKELYGKTVSFGAFNLEEKDGKAKAKELGVKAQTLLVVKGDKKLNLTNEGFMYARTNPDKFKEVLESKIKPLLK